MRDPPDVYAVWDGETYTATWYFDRLSDGSLLEGSYTATVLSSDIADLNTVLINWGRSINP